MICDYVPFLYVMSTSMSGKGKMKTIVDSETGEVIEVEEQNDIAERKLYEVGAISEETFDFLEQYRTVCEQYEMFRFQLEKAMRENGIKKWDNDTFSVTVTDEQLQKRVDTQRLKDDGLYEKYLKLVPTKGTIKINFKKER